MKEAPSDADKPDIPQSERPLESPGGSSGADESKPDTGNDHPASPSGFGNRSVRICPVKQITVDFFKGGSKILNGKNDDLLETLGELAEDMVGLYKMVSNLEVKITQVISVVSSLQNTQESLCPFGGHGEAGAPQGEPRLRPKGIYRTFDFQRARPAMESLKTMKRHYEGKEHEKELLKNTNSVLDLLTGIAQALRYTPFDVPPGTDFDPQTMECLGYGEGEEGKVIRVEQSGYRAGQVLVRPCRVIVGKTQVCLRPGKKPFAQEQRRTQQSRSEIMNDKMHKVIGIDLGTTYSAVASYNTYTEQAEIIRNPESDSDPETTPSVVSTDQMLRKVIVGDAAKRNLPVRPQDTVIEIKREMGDLFTEKNHALERFRAQGVHDINDPIRVFFAGEWMLPQEISAFILMKMKEVAEREIGAEIHDAVVTVPAYFKEPQKKATEEAALLAGLYPRQIIPEPTAAAICYGVDRNETEKKTYLVYDLGGGTFDVSIIQVETGNLNVIATAGDPRLGGGDFDDAIVTWAVEELRKQGIDVSSDPLAKAKIKSVAEPAKIALSYNDSATLPLETIRHELQLVLTKDVFLSLIDKLLNKSLAYVDTAINNAKDQKGIDQNGGCNSPRRRLQQDTQSQGDAAGLFQEG